MKNIKFIKKQVYNIKELWILLKRFKVVLWYKKVEKCNIKIKNIKPTPKSIIHKNPINISPFSDNKKKPYVSKYKPLKNHVVKMFIVLEKSNIMVITNNWTMLSSLIIYTQILFEYVSSFIKRIGIKCSFEMFIVYIMIIIKFESCWSKISI